MADDFLTEEEKERLRLQVGARPTAASGVAPLRMADVKYGTTAPPQLGQGPMPGAFERLATGAGDIMAGREPPPLPAETTEEAPPGGDTSGGPPKIDDAERRRRRRRRRRQRREDTRWQQSVKGLFNKVVTNWDLGFPQGIPLGTNFDDPNLVPFARLPQNVREAILEPYPQGTQPMFFDKSQLNDDEMTVLTNMIAAGDNEREMRRLAESAEREGARRPQLAQTARGYRDG